MISSTQLDGTTVCRHLPGAADREAFVTYSGEVLCPNLRRGDIMVIWTTSPFIKARKWPP
jgi:hypothetical protein